jgi:hypothetical protein
VLYYACGRSDIVTDVECGFIGEDQSFYETILVHFQLHILEKFMPFVCCCRILYGLKHCRLCITFHPIIFGMPNSLLALANCLEGNLTKRLTHSFNIVIRQMRSTRAPASTLASNFHKLLVPSGYIILVWRVSFKPCTKLTLHWNHRSGRLKTEHTENLGKWSCGPAESMRSELPVAHEKFGQFQLLTVFFVPV